MRRKEDAIRFGIKPKQQVIGISMKRQDEMQEVLLAQEKTRQELVNELESTAGKKKCLQGCKASSKIQAGCSRSKLKRCVHKLSKSQKVDLRKSPLKLWTCKRLKFN